MSIKIYILGSLSNMAKGEQPFEVHGKTVGDCLEHLVSLMPRMKEVLFYKRGEALALRSRIKVQVNNESLGAAGLAKEVRDGDQIHIKMIIQ